MARPVGWRWSPIPQHLVKSEDYLDLAPEVNAGSLLDRLYAYACDRYGIFVAGFRPLRNATGLEGNGAAFDAAIARLEAGGFVYLWTSPDGVSRGILANYNGDSGLPASLFCRRPVIDPDCIPPDEIASVCGWVPPDDVVPFPEVSHDKPPSKSRETSDNVATKVRQSHDVSSRVETETETETETENKKRRESAEPAPAKAGAAPPEPSAPAVVSEPEQPPTLDDFPATLHAPLTDWLDECVKAGAGKWNRDKQLVRQAKVLLALVEAYGEPTVRRAMEIHVAKGPEFFNRGQMGERGATQYLNGVCRKTTPEELQRWATGAPQTFASQRPQPARYTGFGVQCGPAPATHVTKARPWGELDWDVAQDYDVDRETWEASRLELGMPI